MRTETLAPPNVECRSLREESWNQACAEKYIRSEQAGHDLGDDVIRQWVHQHWEGFLRARWIEHMEGERFWLELRREEFGLFKRLDPKLKPLLDKIVDQLKAGGENLTVTLWSWKTCKEQQERDNVHYILEMIDVNGHRMRCHFSET